MCHHFSHAHAGTVDRSEEKKTFRFANAHTPRLRDIPTVGVPQGVERESKLACILLLETMAWSRFIKLICKARGDDKTPPHIVCLSLSLSFKKQCHGLALCHMGDHSLG